MYSVENIYTLYYYYNIIYIRCIVPVRMCIFYIILLFMTGNYFVLLVVVILAYCSYYIIFNMIKLPLYYYLIARRNHNLCGTFLFSFFLDYYIFFRNTSKHICLEPDYSLVIICPLTLWFRYWDHSSPMCKT